MLDIDWLFVFWLALGAIIYVWPDFGPLRKFKPLTAAELEEISKNYSNIAGKFLGWGLLVALVTMFMFLGATRLLRELDNDLLHPLIGGGLLPTFGLINSLFALYIGVYPASKFWGQKTAFYYSENDEIRDIARNHIVSIFAVYCFTAIYVLLVIMLSP